MEAITLYTKRATLESFIKTRIFAESVRRNIRTKVKLCKRCRSFALALEAFLEEPVFERSWYREQRNRNRSVKIAKQSLQENCHLCFQLAPLLQENCHLCLELAPLLHDDGKHEVSLRYLDMWNSETERYSPCLFIDICIWIPAKPDRSQRPHLAYSSPSIRYAPGKILPIHADFGLVKRWLKHCRDAHERICDKESKLAVSPLRLIDCVSEELCIARPDCPYIALSYTWGDTALEESLTGLGLPTTLPKTIQDAIIVARALDIPHLWVDRYCIDQSNADEVHQLVHSMDKIYSNAELTIVASAGTGPTCGLPGIGDTPRRVQNALRVGTHTLVLLPRLGREIRESTWNSRGWTFQEMLLSRRRLVFTESEMYFQCRCDTFVESLEVPLKGFSCLQGDDYSAFPYNDSDCDPNYIYDRLGEYYSRQMSFNNDILEAFEGIFTAYREVNIKRGSRFSHFWGIPILSSDKDSKSLELDSFLRGLLFRVEGYPLGPEQPRGNQNTRFPSWSWAACKARRPKNGQSKLWFGAQNTQQYARHGTVIHFTHFDGTHVSLAEYASRMDDYTRYCPWIDITSWSISSSMYTCYESEMELEVLDPQSISIHLDNSPSGHRPSWDGRNFALVFISQVSSVFVEGLLLEAVDDGHWRRVGIWNAYQALFFEPRDPPLLIDKERKDGLGAKWEMRTLRVV